MKEVPGRKVESSLLRGIVGTVEMQALAAFPGSKNGAFEVQLWHCQLSWPIGCGKRHRKVAD